MKKYNPIFYLLFILLVMGAFASMAQNSYGLKIIGGVAFVFAIVFIIEIISRWRSREEKKLYSLVEPACLFVLAVIFGFRVFYIYFPFIELLFGIAATVLMIVYLKEMVTRFRHYQSKNNFLATLVIFFHLSIILFLGSLALLSFAPKTAEITAVVAFILLLTFIVTGLFKRELLVDGVKMSAFTMVRHFKGHSLIIVFLFLLFSLYTGLTRIGLLPGIYSDEFPRAYYQLVDKAASKEEKSADGKYKYEEFMEQYKEFLKHVDLKNQ